MMVSLLFYGFKGRSRLFEHELLDLDQESPVAYKEELACRM